MRRALPALLLALPLLALSAQDIVVSDLEGSPVLITSDGSSPLEEGAAVPASGRLSLGEDSKVTLREGSRKVELFRRGLYEIGELFTFRPLGKVEFEQIFEARIKSVNLALKRGGPESTETIIATSVLETAEREPEQLIEGVRHLVSGRYAEARSSFNTFLESPPEEEGGAVHLAQVLAAQSAFFLDENAEAYETLSRIRPSSGDSHYPLYLLLRAQLLIESHAFADALETLAEYLAEPSGSEADLQTARLLTGVAYEGLGNLPVARTYYRRATSPDPTSDAAKAARRLLE